VPAKTALYRVRLSRARHRRLAYRMRVTGFFSRETCSRHCRGRKDRRGTRRETSGSQMLASKESHIHVENLLRGMSSPLARNSALYRSLIWSRLWPAALVRNASNTSWRSVPIARRAWTPADSLLGRSFSAPGQVHDSRQVCSRTVFRLPASGHKEWQPHLAQQRAYFKADRSVVAAAALAAGGCMQHSPLQDARETYPDHLQPTPLAATRMAGQGLRPGARSSGPAFPDLGGQFGCALGGHPCCSGW
jgi:hypothetical protein